MSMEVEAELKLMVYILYTHRLCAELKLKTTSLREVIYSVTLEAMADDSYKQVFLEAHNQYRKRHQAPELKYSEELCSAAQAWANHLLSKKSLAHSDTENGENVYYSFSSQKKELKGSEAVDSWYSEIKDYNFSSPGHQPDTGHFTQVVWKSSTELGVGLATDGKKVFVVGQYKPSGNITNDGYYEKNVLPKA